MQEYAAVFRDGPTLKTGCEKLSLIWKEMENIKVWDICSCLLIGVSFLWSVLVFTVSFGGLMIYL